MRHAFAAARAGRDVPLELVGCAAPGDNAALAYASFLSVRCHIGHGTGIEPAAIVCAFSRVGPQSLVRAGACVKQRDTHSARSVLDGFPARLVDTLTDLPGRPSWALPAEAAELIHRLDR